MRIKKLFVDLIVVFIWERGTHCSSYLVVVEVFPLHARALVTTGDIIHVALVSSSLCMWRFLVVLGKLTVGQGAVAGGSHSEKYCKDWQAEETVTVKDDFQAVISLHLTFFFSMGAVWHVNWFETGGYYLTPVDSRVDSDWCDWNIYFEVPILCINEVIYIQAGRYSAFSWRRNSEKN
jgi:hypothetical protein